MPKRNRRNVIRTDGLTREQVIELAIIKMQWSRTKVLSWYELENAALKKRRPSEVVDDGDTEVIEALLDKREADRIREQEKKKK